jgi:spermidine synthase
VKPQSTLGRATTPDGKELVLYERDGVYSIRVNGLELMSSRAHGSEEDLARLVLTRVKGPAPVILVGGLGLGYTLRAVLDAVPAKSRVVVAEIFPAVVEWNRSELADLAGAPLLDHRVRVETTDVATLIKSSSAAFDAILLDVDNGPEAFTIARNRNLYGPRGLAMIRRSLRPKGVLGVWSADPDRPFERRLSKAGFRVHSETVPAYHGARGPKGAKHTIFIAKLP